MSYKTIFVCLTTQANSQRLTRVGCLLAEKFDAHLIGLHTLQELLVYSGASLHIKQETIDAFRAEQQHQSDKIKKVFLEEMDTCGRVGEWRLVEADGVNAGDRLVEHSRCADLVVMSQADPDTDRPDQAGIQKQVIEESGLPVVVVPNSVEPETIGTSVLIGWSATREATRALHASIPFVRDGGKASIIWVSKSRSSGSHLSQTAHEIAIGLDRHGIETTVTHWDNVDISIGDAILNEADVCGADLIVSGAFGHSRIYDFVVGATTTHLLEHMTVPILFSN